MSHKRRRCEPPHPDCATMPITRCAHRSEDVVAIIRATAVATSRSLRVPVEQVIVLAVDWTDSHVPHMLPDDARNGDGPVVRTQLVKSGFHRAYFRAFRDISVPLPSMAACEGREPFTHRSKSLFFRVSSRCVTG